MANHAATPLLTLRSPEPRASFGWRATCRRRVSTEAASVKCCEAAKVDRSSPFARKFLGDPIDGGVGIASWQTMQPLRFSPFDRPNRQLPSGCDRAAGDVSPPEPTQRR